MGDEVVVVVADHHRELRRGGLAPPAADPLPELDAEELLDSVDSEVVQAEPDDDGVGVLLGTCANCDHPFKVVGVSITRLLTSEYIIA